jgi:hypothetical protein
MLSTGDPASGEFYEHYVRPSVPRSNATYYSHGTTAICAANSGQVIGAMTIIVVEPTQGTSNVDIGSKLMFSLLPISTKTAIYVYKPEVVTPPARAAENSRREMAERTAVYEARLKAIDDYRKSLQVGSATNCGMIIDMRGAVAQLQQDGIYSGVTAPTRWVRMDQLLPRGNACSAF